MTNSPFNDFTDIWGIDPDEMNDLMILKEHPSDEILALIKPYPLNENDLCPGSADALRKKLTEEGFEGKEVEEAVRNLVPDIIEHKNGIAFTYIIDWRPMFHSIDAWNYLTKDIVDKIGVSADKLYDYSIRNLDLDNAILCDLDEWDEPVDNCNVFQMRIPRPLSPAYDCALLLSEELWKSFYNTVKRPYYVLPMFRECLIVILETDGHPDMNMDALIKKVVKFAPKRYGLFSNAKYYYDGSTLKNITG